MYVRVWSTGAGNWGRSTSLFLHRLPDFIVAVVVLTAVENNGIKFNGRKLFKGEVDGGGKDVSSGK